MLNKSIFFSEIFDILDTDSININKHFEYRDLVNNY